MAYSVPSGGRLRPTEVWDSLGRTAALWLAAIRWLAPLPALGLFRALERHGSMDGEGAA